MIIGTTNVLKDFSHPNKWTFENQNGGHFFLQMAFHNLAYSIWVILVFIYMLSSMLKPFMLS